MWRHAGGCCRSRKSAAATVFLSAERVDVANQAGGRREVCFFFFQLQFKEKPKNEAWGPLRRPARCTKGN